MRTSTLTLVFVSLTFAACSDDGGGGTGETGGTTGTSGQDTSSTTINPTTSASASASTGAEESTGATTLTTTGVDGSSTGGGFDCPGGMPEDGMYGACQGPNMNYCPGAGQCLNIMGDGMGGDDYITCIRGCASVCNCWVPPEGDHTAELLCDNFEFPDSNCEKVGANCSCYLDCSDGKTCPEGLECVVLAAGASICALAVEPSPATSSSGGTDSGSGTDSGTGESDSGSSGSTG